MALREEQGWSIEENMVGNMVGVEENRVGVEENRVGVEVNRLGE